MELAGQSKEVIVKYTLENKKAVASYRTPHVL